MYILTHNSVEEADTYLARFILDLLEYTINVSGSAVLALSGGSTPVNLYKEIASNATENAKEKSYLIQVDERFVEKESTRSNQRMIRNIFGDWNFYAMEPSDETDDVEVAASKSSKRYRALFETLGKTSADISLLGMGSDGHTASLFPNNKDYLNQREGEDMIVFGTFVESQGENRLSLSSHQLDQSKKILYFTGSEKFETLKLALDEGDEVKFPILSVIHDCEIHCADIDTDPLTAKAGLYSLGE